MRRNTQRTVLVLAALSAVGMTAVGCASSSSASASPTRTLVYQPNYTPDARNQTLVAGDSLGRSMFEQGAIVASRAHAELRYAGVVE